MRTTTTLVAVVWLVVALVLVVYGLFAIGFQEGDSDDAFILVGGTEVDADIAGAVALLLAVAFLGVCAAVVMSRLRRQARRGRRSSKRCSVPRARRFTL